jgi:hypothetical protein
MSKPKGFVDLDASDAIEKLQKQVRFLSSGALAQANANAINRAGRAARTRWGQRIREKVNVRASQTKDAFVFSGASKTKQSASITVKKDFQFPIGSFSKLRQTRQGVTVQIFKGAARTIFRGAFIIDQYGGNAFWRRGKDRGPLRMIYGPSIVALARRYQPAAEARFIEVYEERIKNEINFAIARANR